MPANQLRGWPFSEFVCFRGLAVLDDSFAKMTYASPKQKFEIFRVDRPAGQLAARWLVQKLPGGSAGLLRG